jgi:hypothetical protein
MVSPEAASVLEVSEEVVVLESVLVVLEELELDPQAARLRIKQVARNVDKNFFIMRHSFFFQMGAL